MYQEVHFYGLTRIRGVNAPLQDPLTLPVGRYGEKTIVYPFLPINPHIMVFTGNSGQIWAVEPIRGQFFGVKRLYVLMIKLVNQRRFLKYTSGIRH